MRLNKFSCVRMNGYLSFEISLKRDVSFLIGINGSGKTSALKAIMALLGPDIDWLMTAKYDSISVQLECEKRKIEIQCERPVDQKDLIEFKFIEGKTSIEASLSELEYRASLRQHDDYFRDEDGDLVRIRENRFEAPDNIEAFAAVRRLPTPIFLGLDRTTLPTAGGRANQRIRRPGGPRRPHASLRTFLDESVAQAESIAVDAMRRASLLRSRRAGQLREDILLTLFSDVKSEAITLPRTRDLQRFERTRKSLTTAFKIIGIEQNRLARTIDPFFDEITKTASHLVNHKSVQDLFSAETSDELREKFFSWISIGPRLSLIRKAEELVSKFNDDETIIFRETNSYISIVNSFFRDSKKEIRFGEDSSLTVSLASGVDADAYHLSSGERQLFVLITTLMFNEDHKNSNILIIDEPELSLHIKWQEMFVDSLLAANPSTQLIFATHSPSIIGSRDQQCVDLT